MYACMRRRKDQSDIPAMLTITTVEKISPSRQLETLCQSRSSLPPLKNALAMKRIPVPTNPFNNCLIR